MGMTDKQFAAYLRQLLLNIMEVEELLENADIEKTKAKVHIIRDSLQKSLED